MLNFYRIKLACFKVGFLRTIVRRVRFKRNKKISKIREELIGKYAKNRSFIDVGCMWGVNGFFSFLAEDLGAREVTGFDIYPPSEEFRRIHQKRNSKVRFVQGDLNSVQTLNEIGKFEVVYCTGILYHVPDPLYTLARLRQICGDSLILGTAIIPEMNGIKNLSVLYPYLDEKQRGIWDTKSGEQIAITTPYDPKQGYGNWVWGFTGSCLESMLKMAGFNIVEKHIGKFYAYVVCRLSSDEFMPVSGDWGEPSYKENIREYKFE